MSLWIADASRRTTCLKICEANFTEAPHYPVLSCPAHHPEASRWCEIAVAPAGSAGQKHFTHSTDTVLACRAELWSREERLALYRRRIEEDTYKVSSCTLALANYRAYVTGGGDETLASCKRTPPMFCFAHRWSDHIVQKPPQSYLLWSSTNQGSAHGPRVMCSVVCWHYWGRLSAVSVRLFAQHRLQ